VIIGSISMNENSFTFRIPSEEVAYIKRTVLFIHFA
jgi:hypothetical protein